ncbi:hypothetical protein SLA2020_207530 [Shorea laevis]
MGGASSHKSSFAAVPWLVGGDFKEIRALCERSDWQSISCLPKESEVFNKMLNEVEIHDLPIAGSFFTWSNKRCLDPIAKKLDHLMVNEFWFDVFPNTTAEFL